MNFIEKQKIIDFLTPYAESINAEIIDVELKSGKNAYLTVFLDTETGVDLDTLEKFHNLINAPLDELDPYPQAYTLNVSSPGVDRPLKTERDFLRKMGKLVEVKLYANKNGKKLYEGVLKAYNGDSVTVEISGKDVIFKLEEIAKICEAIIF
ncbi:MAG: ribosome maturation factor RimP [Clostridia bacterium]|nr:ribosome maturation factor RimP [Clostridia bacterium]